MSDYLGLKIPEKITIVERQIDQSPSWGTKRTVPQGYVVPAGDMKQLASAHTWADWTESKREGDRWVKGEEKPGIEHTYENGKFKMTVKESAAGSWQGGKLSFWTCEIEAPDGKHFDIGINSDYLCETIMHNTLIKGTVQGDIWIGKCKGNTMAVTEGQPSYIQAMKDEDKRQTQQSNKYKPGDLVRTLTSIDLYVGTWYQLFNVTTDEDRWNYWGRRKCDYNITLFKKPVERYAFRSIWECNGELQPRHCIDIKNTKPKRILTDQTMDVSTIYDEVKQSLLEQAKPGRQRTFGSEDWYVYGTGSGTGSRLLEVLQFADSPDKSYDIKAIIEEVKRMNTAWGYDGTIIVKNELGEVLQTIKC